jgi:hypothetical protein
VHSVATLSGIVRATGGRIRRLQCVDDGLSASTTFSTGSECMEFQMICEEAAAMVMRQSRFVIREHCSCMNK